MASQNPKPWSAGFHRNNTFSNQSKLMDSLTTPASVCDRSPPPLPNTPLQPPTAVTSTLPPVPARHHTTSALSLARPNFGYGGFSSPYGYNPGLGGMGLGMGGFSTLTPGFGGEGMVTQSIENQMRPAFESVLSVVQAAASITAVLESSYMAVYSCVRAVSGLADHFGRLSTQVRSLVASIGVIKLVRRWMRRLLDWLGVAPAQQERVWREVQREAVLKTEAKQRGSKGNRWASVLFLAVVLGAPAVVWNLVNALMKRSNNDWTAQGGSCFVGRSKFNFTANNQDELSIRLGETFRVAPKEFQSQEAGWLMACNNSGGRGLIPADYVEILGRLDASNVSAKEQNTLEPSSQSSSNLVQSSSDIPKTIS